MKHLNKIIAATLVTGGLIGTTVITHAESKGHDSESKMLISEVTIKMNKAIEIALATIPGTPSEVEFEVEDGRSIWEVEVVSVDQQVYELEIDAVSGRVLKQELDD